MGRLAAIVLLGVAFTAPAVAEASTIYPLGDGYFCRGWKTDAVTCGAVYSASRGGGVRILFYSASKDRVRNISYRACAESPSGEVRCVPRRTRHKSRGKEDRNFTIKNDLRITIDRFRFTSAFPHRDPGVYKLSFRRGGKQWGQVIRLRLMR